MYFTKCIHLFSVSAPVLRTNSTIRRASYWEIVLLGDGYSWGKDRRLLFPDSLANHFDHHRKYLWSEIPMELRNSVEISCFYAHLITPFGIPHKPDRKPRDSIIRLQVVPSSRTFTECFTLYKQRFPMPLQPPEPTGNRNQQRERKAISQ